jgi:hypothetical protein
MARYFFDFLGSSLTTHDDEGADCPDKDAVSRKALEALCEIAADHPQRYLGQNLRIAVRNQADQVVMTASLQLSASWLAAEQTAAA